MNWLDIVIILIVAGTTLAAFRAGFIREVITLVSAFVGIVVAGQLYDDLAEDVLVFIDNRGAALAISFLVLLGSVYLAGQLLAYLLKRAASLLLLGWADSAGGALFGLLKGLIIVEVLLILFVTYPHFGLDGAIDDSALAPAFLDRVPLVLRLLPGEFDDKVSDFLAPPTS